MPTCSRASTASCCCSTARTPPRPTQLMAAAPNIREAICIDAEGTGRPSLAQWSTGCARDARRRAGRRRRSVRDLPDRRHDGEVEGRDDHASQHRDTVRELLRALPLSRRHAAPGRRADDPHGGYRRRDALRARRHQRHHEQGLAAGRRRRDREASHHAPVPAADRALHDAGAAGHSQARFQFAAALPGRRGADVAREAQGSDRRCSARS